MSAEKIHEAPKDNVVRNKFNNGHGGDGGGYNGDMEQRISKLETAADSTRDALHKVDARLTVIEKTMATKEDLHRELTAQTWRVVTYVTGLVVTVSGALVAATYFIAIHAK
ncbi:hypothetical protein HQ393_05015 [Chitinibacter bivalviorum]|uniref:Uncharacterized protein n=1 Tax=Chitinibacter bivalviorum TaxID=2739434 RepID=A0A7H9BGF4_9NEIS|nr:hypothetical protein [Chitinibacter bivalviorum]QLG87665.1 hypothetical protein HQ393_05015 [Chitinibacter bivalviorum]